MNEGFSSLFHLPSFSFSLSSRAGEAGQTFTKIWRRWGSSSPLFELLYIGSVANAISGHQISYSLLSRKQFIPPALHLVSRPGHHEQAFSLNLWLGDWHSCICCVIPAALPCKDTAKGVTEHKQKVQCTQSLVQAERLMENYSVSRGTKQTLHQNGTSHACMEQREERRGKARERGDGGVGGKDRKD